MSTIQRRLVVAAPLMAASLALAACSSSSATPSADAVSGGDGQGSDDVTVGIIAISDVAPVPLGIQEGLFEDAGLNLATESAASGAAIVPAVTSGQYEFGFSNGVSLMVAAEQNIPITIIGSGVSTVGDPELEPEGVVARPDSGIERPADLSGKSVGVAVRNSFTELAISATVDNDGGDSSTIQYVQLPLNDIAAAVERGEVDAGQVVEPFLTASEDLGLESVASTFASSRTDGEPLTASYYFTSTAFAEQNPEVVQKFVDALDEAKELASSDDQLVRDVLPTYTQLDAATIEKVRLPDWPVGTDRDSLEVLGKLGVDGGLLTTEPDLEGLLWQP